MADGADEGHIAVLVEHARRALIHELGARKVDVWLGKDGLVQHDVKLIAAIVIDALRPVLGGDEAMALTTRLHDQGVLAPPLAIDPNDW